MSFDSRYLEILVQDYVHLHCNKDTGEINYFTDFKRVSMDFRVYIIRTGEFSSYSESVISNNGNKLVNKKSIHRLIK